MRSKRNINLFRTAKRRLAWVGFGSALLASSVFGYSVLMKNEAAYRAAIRSASPGVCMSFNRGLLENFKLWSCSISALAGAGIIACGLALRFPEA